MKSVMLPDHPKLTLDSLHETADSPVNGLVHRYPDKALFLRESASVGANTASVHRPASHVLLTNI